MTSIPFWYGYLCATSGTAALYFVKYWRVTHDRLFLAFATAFVLLAANWAVLSVTNPSDDTRHYVYVIRLFAFGVLLVGIMDKNRRAR